MDRIQDKAVKFFYDVRKKKSAVGSKTERNDCKPEPVQNVYIHNTDISSNNCYYCQKVFLSPKFLLKHIMRRHPDNLIQLHRNCLKPESNNNSIDSHNFLKFLQDEFTKLREELIVVKQSDEVSRSDNHVLNKDENDEHKKYESQHASSTSRDHKYGDWHNMNDSGSNELMIVKEKVLDLENNIQCLFYKFEELDTVVKDKVMPEQDVHNLITANENKILDVHEAKFLELRSTLHDKLQNMLSNHLRQNNIELQSQFFELREDIARLDHLIDSFRKQINSPDHLKDLEKKFNDKIIHFIGRGGRSKSVAPRTRYSAFRSKSGIPRHTPSYLKNKEASKKKTESDIEAAHIAENFSKKSISQSPKLGAFELSCMLTQKMSSLGIDPSASKMSSDEYNGKMKLIEFEKKQLLKKNGNFLKTYNKINLLADDRVNYTLQQKKRRKLRFSEPLISNKNNHKSNPKKIQNKTYPNVENGSFTFSEPNVVLKSSRENIQNRIHSSDINSHEFSLSEIGKSDKCFRNFLETCRSKYELQSTPLKEHASTGDVHEVDSQVVGIKNINTDRLANSKLFASEGKVLLVQNFESSSSTLEEDVLGKDIVAEPSNNFPEEKVPSDDELDSLSEWEDEKDNS